MIFYEFASAFGEYVKLYRNNPSVKNHRFLTAPFTQGSLGRSRARKYLYL